MALDVKVKIDLAKPIGRVGSWFPLLYVLENATSTAAENPDEGTSETTSYTYEEFTDFASLTTTHNDTDSDIYKAANVLFSQENVPNKVGVMKTATADTTALATCIDEGWRQIVLVGAWDTTAIKTISTYIDGLKNTHQKMLFATVDKTDASSLLSGTSALASERTVLVVGKENEACAVVGATAGLEVGSFTYKNIIVNDTVNAEAVTETELTNLGGKAIVILEKAGDKVTSDGKATSGEFIDIVDSKDYILQGIEYGVQKVFNNNKKVPYTNAGIALLEAATLGVLVDAYNNGMIATNDDGTPAYSVSFAMRSETTESDRATRSYPYGKFSFSLAGAIHTAEIKGTITV